MRAKTTADAAGFSNPLTRAVSELSRPRKVQKSLLLILGIISPEEVVFSRGMRATLFEFRHRWWVIFLIFCAAFAPYSFDPTNSGAAIVEWLARRFGAEPTVNWYRVIFAFGTLLLILAACLRTWGTSYLREEVMSDTRVRTERLLADGPY